MRLDVEGVVEFKTVHGKDHPDEVADSLSAYGGDRLLRQLRNLGRQPISSLCEMFV